MTDREIIRAEVESWYNESLRRAKIVDADYNNGKADAYRNVLTQIDSMEKEPSIPDIVDEHFLEMLGNEEPILEILAKYLDHVPDEEAAKTKKAIDGWFNKCFPKLKPSVEEAMADVEEKARIFTAAHKGESADGRYGILVVTARST